MADRIPRRRDGRRVHPAERVCGGPLAPECRHLLDRAVRRQRTRGAAADDHARTRRRRASARPPRGARQTPVSGRDAGIHNRDMHGQNRNSHAESDARHRCLDSRGGGLPAGGHAVRGRGQPSPATDRGGNLYCEHGRDRAGRRAGTRRPHRDCADARGPDARRRHRCCRTEPPPPRALPLRSQAPDDVDDRRGSRRHARRSLQGRRRGDPYAVHADRRGRRNGRSPDPAAEARRSRRGRPAEHPRPPCPRRRPTAAASRRTTACPS